MLFYGVGNTVKELQVVVERLRNPAEVGAPQVSVTEVGLAQANIPEVQTPQRLPPEVSDDEVAITLAVLAARLGGVRWAPIG